MAEKSISFDYRKWRGDREFWQNAHRRYDFPVTVRKIGDDPDKGSDA
ncbi:hypothetical protein ACWDUX_30055 [Streptomyces sp. NPDC003444]